MYQSSKFKGSYIIVQISCVEEKAEWDEAGWNPRKQRKHMQTPHQMSSFLLWTSGQAASLLQEWHRHLSTHIYNEFKVYQLTKHLHVFGT